MKTYFIVSDIHGRYKELIKALKESGFDKKNKDHIFVSLGDLFDRGEENYLLLDFVMNKLDKNRRILLWGNHEFLLLNIIKNGFLRDFDFYPNRTSRTVIEFINYMKDQDYKGKKKYHSNLDIERDLLAIKDFDLPKDITNLKDFTMLNDYFKELVYFLKIDKYYLSHSGYYSRNMKTFGNQGLIDTTWYYPFDSQRDIAYPIENYPGTTISIHGHTHAFLYFEYINGYSNKTDIYNDGKEIVLDNPYIVHVYKIKTNKEPEIDVFK